MKSIVSHIEFLLTQHDCVIVPGWGAFVVQHDNAMIDSQKHILPPRSWISFNPLLSHNDGILAHSIMRAEQCTFDAAMYSINEQVNEWRETLQQEHRIEWERIGCFVAQQDGALIFTEATNCVVNAPHMLLQPVAIPQLVDILVAEQEDEVSQPVAYEQPAIKWYHQAWQAVASVAAIAIFMLFIATPVDNFQPTNEYAGIVAHEVLGYTIEQHTSNIEDSENTLIDSTLTQEPIEAIAIDNNENIEVEETTIIQPIVNEITTETPRYILVVGSLPSRTLAEKQIQEFRAAGITQAIEIYESNGKFRLYIEGYDTMHDAQLRLQHYNTQQPATFAGIWICSTR